MKIGAHILYALLAAFSWSLGGYFEKLGMEKGGFSRPEALAVRLIISLALVVCIGGTGMWNKIFIIEWRPFLYLAIGGGVIAGFIGMLSFYQALHLGSLHTVVGYTFSATVLFGFVWAYLLGGEHIT